MSDDIVTILGKLPDWTPEKERALAKLGPVVPPGLTLDKTTIDSTEKCLACNHARASHNQDVGNGEMTECSECGCHQFATMTQDELNEVFVDGVAEIGA